MILSIHGDGSACQDEAARLLPWFVAGTLSEDEAERVREHMNQCPTCAADWQREKQVRALIQDDSAVAQAPQPGLQNLMSRIDELERELPTFASRQKPPARAPRRFGAVRWLAAAAIIQAVGLGFLGVLLWERGAELRAPRFHTLTASAPAAIGEQRIRVVFSPDMPIGQMQDLLKSIPATVVAGPTDAGVYTLAVAHEHTEIGPVLARLRSNAGILFAEPQVARRGD